MAREQILIVDDEASIVQLYKLQLKTHFDIEIAESGEEGLKLISERGPFAVVVSDNEMPGMNGPEFLSRVQQESPLTVRVMLTGNNEQEVAVEAVNEGQIFRFLSKPCPSERLSKALHASVQHYRLLVAERELLDRTLKGSVNLLIEMLSVVKPLAFGRAARVQRIVEQLCAETNVESAWEVSLAAMLSQVGCISLSDEALEKLHAGEELSNSEQLEYAGHARFGAELVRRIPRLERVGELIAEQETPHTQLQELGRDNLLKRAAFLKIAVTYDRLTTIGKMPREAVSILLEDPATYSPEVAEILDTLVESKVESAQSEVKVAQLRTGMLLVRDVVQHNGAILVTRGQEITEMLLDQLQRRSSSIVEPITVIHGDIVEEVGTNLANVTKSIDLGDMELPDSSLRNSLD